MRNEGGLGEREEARFGQFKHLRARTGRNEGGGWQSTRVMGGEAWYCQFEHLRARICRTKGGECAGGLGFANSSTCALEFAEPGVVGG